MSEPNSSRRPQLPLHGAFNPSSAQRLQQELLQEDPLVRIRV